MGEIDPIENIWRMIRKVILITVIRNDTSPKECTNWDSTK
jgi:hypothetical protein